MSDLEGCDSKLGPWSWPRTEAELLEAQRQLAAQTVELWEFEPQRWASTRVAACFICFGRGGGGRGAEGDPGWASAALYRADHCLHSRGVTGVAGATYTPGFLALREGPLLEAAVRALEAPFDVLLVDATGRDHPERAGLALQLGARLDVPTVGVTNRLLVATGTPPANERGATAPFCIANETVGVWVRTRANVRPIAAHAGWRTDAVTAGAVVLATVRRARTPEPLRAARRLARWAREQDLASDGAGA